MNREIPLNNQIEELTRPIKALENHPHPHKHTHRDQHTQTHTNTYRQTHTHKHTQRGPTHDTKCSPLDEGLLPKNPFSLSLCLSLCLSFLFSLCSSGDVLSLPDILNALDVRDVGVVGRRRLGRVEPLPPSFSDLSPFRFRGPSNFGSIEGDPSGGKGSSFSWNKFFTFYK